MRKVWLFAILAAMALVTLVASPLGPREASADVNAVHFGMVGPYGSENTGDAVSTATYGDTVYYFAHYQLPDPATEYDPPLRLRFGPANGMTVVARDVTDGTPIACDMDPGVDCVQFATADGGQTGEIWFEVTVTEDVTVFAGTNNADLEVDDDSVQSVQQVPDCTGVVGQRIGGNCTGDLSVNPSNIGISKAVNPDSVTYAAEETVTYAISVSNDEVTGSVAAPQGAVAITDTMPAGLTSFSLVTVPAPYACSISGTEIDCANSGGAHPAGTTVEIIYSAVVAEATALGTLVNDAQVDVVSQASGDSDTASVEVAGGTLTNSAPADHNFGGVTLDGTDQTISGSMLVLGVNDARGSAPGWSVHITSTTFSTADTTPRTLPATATRLTAVTSGCADGATCVLPTNSVGYANFIVPAGVTAPPATKLFTAAVGTGMRNIVLAATVAIDVPANAYAGTYNSTIMTTVSTGP